MKCSNKISSSELNTNTKKRKDTLYDISFQTVHYRITLKIKLHFFTQFLAKFLLKLFKIIIFYFLNFFYNLKKNLTL